MLIFSVVDYVDNSINLVANLNEFDPDMAACTHLYIELC